MMTLLYLLIFAGLAAGGIAYARFRAKQKELEYSDESPVRKKHSKIEEDLDRIREILRDSPELEVSEIERLLNVSHDTACFYIDRLCDEGYVEHIDERGRYLYYPDIPPDA